MNSNTDTIGSLKLPRALSGESWQRHVVTVLTALEVSHGLLVVECSEVQSFDDDGLDLLIGLSRYSERRQVRVALANAPEALRQQLQSRGLAWLFEWR